ncbi:MAG: 3-isopropylmalate dehydratase, partial [Nitrospiraceae bacterium]|nr:3-isopropylmalate dehydratase [Nitrospiraceae bacterium]
MAPQDEQAGRGQTLVEKVIARAAGLEAVRPGQMVTASVDLAFAH